jgi:hypothetical protein
MIDGSCYSGQMTYKPICGTDLFRDKLSTAR